MMDVSVLMEVIAAGISHGGFSWMREARGFMDRDRTDCCSNVCVTLLMPCYSLLAIMGQVIAELVFCGFETDTKALHVPD